MSEDNDLDISLLIRPPEGAMLMIEEMLEATQLNPKDSEAVWSDRNNGHVYYRVWSWFKMDYVVWMLLLHRTKGIYFWAPLNHSQYVPPTHVV